MRRFLGHSILVLTLLPVLLATAYAPEGVQVSTDSGQCDLASIVSAGELSDLRWPVFTDFQSQVRQFYQATGYALAWSAEYGPTPQARAMIALLQESGKEGLQPEDYDGSRWDSRLSSFAQPTAPSACERARFDLALTVSAMRYISALHNGRIDPRHFQFNLKVGAKKVDLAEFLRTQVVGSDDISSVLTQVSPPYLGYSRTLVALNHYLALAREGEGEPLPVLDEVLSPGDAYIGAPQLAERLRRTGDLPLGAKTASSQVYDGALVKAVKHFQRRHGLSADGRIGPETMRQITAPFSQRVSQLQLSLERWRWLRADLQSRLIAVNIPEFELWAYEDHSVSLSMRAIVGTAFSHETPVFEDQLESVIFRPSWNVPASIQEKELVPAIEKDRRYLAKHHYEITNHQGEVVTTDRVDNRTLRLLRAGMLEIRQKAGPANSLGLIKFVFPNQYGVYLHGTPEQKLFGRERRDFSHGCIRVENPARLAAWVLRDQPEWTPTRILEAMRGEETITVKLTSPIPVLILYGTAVADEEGDIHFSDDIYGHDAALESALAKGYPYP